MSKDKTEHNLYNSKSDVEKYLKSDKAFMANRSAAEFNAFVEGAMFMLEDKAAYIEKLKNRIKNNQEKILELTNELAPYRELYEDFEMVPRRAKKTKTKLSEFREVEDVEELLTFEEDDYGDVTGCDFQ